MSLDPGITKEFAESIVEYRKTKPFKLPGDIGNVGLGSKLITTDMMVQGSMNYRIRSVAEENKIRRVIESVVEKGTGTVRVKYWCER